MTLTNYHNVAYFSSLQMNEAKEIEFLNMKYHVKLNKKKNLKGEELGKETLIVKRTMYVSK